MAIPAGGSHKMLGLAGGSGEAIHIVQVHGLAAAIGVTEILEKLEF